MNSLHSDIQDLFIVWVPGVTAKTHFYQKKVDNRVVSFLFYSTDLNSGKNNGKLKPSNTTQPKKKCQEIKKKYLYYNVNWNIH